MTDRTYVRAWIYREEAERIREGVKTVREQMNDQNFLVAMRLGGNTRSHPEHDG